MSGSKWETNVGTPPYNSSFVEVQYSNGECEIDHVSNFDWTKSFSEEDYRIEKWRPAQRAERGEVLKSEVINDPVNHPKHYCSHPSGIECIQITEHYNFNIGNSIKYCWRAGLKDEDTDVQDLKKAIWYITREIERLEKMK